MNTAVEVKGTLIEFETEMIESRPEAFETRLVSVAGEVIGIIEGLRSERKGRVWACGRNATRHAYPNGAAAETVRDWARTVGLTSEVVNYKITQYLDGQGERWAFMRATPERGFTMDTEGTLAQVTQAARSLAINHPGMFSVETLDGALVTTFVGRCEIPRD